MTRIPPEEAGKIVFKNIGIQEARYAFELYQQVFVEKQSLDNCDGIWNTVRAISAVYSAGKINGIRAERERRRTGKKAHA